LVKLRSDQIFQFLTQVNLYNGHKTVALCYYLLAVVIGVGQVLQVLAL